MFKASFQKFPAVLILTIFSIQTTTQSFAQSLAPAMNLPQVGSMVGLSEIYQPALIRGMQMFPDNPLRFDFIVDAGDSGLNQDTLKDEADRMIRYFYASLTVPETELWVNLSPYEGDRIIPDSFAVTEMGRDLLAQDYLLKQITASLMYPEGDIGKNFWERVYNKAYEMYGTMDVPMDTFNKVWIMPDQAEIYVEGTKVFVVESRLKVMLEEDYVAMSKSDNVHVPQEEQAKNSDEKMAMMKELIREVMIPEIEREVNQGRNFAPLRQVFNSLILAAWFKKNLKQSLLGQKYVDQKKTDGIQMEDTTVKEAIYQRYLDSFKQGVYDVIKEEYDPLTQNLIPKKYFSGGVRANVSEAMLDVSFDRAQKSFSVLPNMFSVTTEARTFDSAMLFEFSKPFLFGTNDKVIKDAIFQNELLEIDSDTQRNILKNGFDNLKSVLEGQDSRSILPMNQKANILGWIERFLSKIDEDSRAVVFFDEQQSILDGRKFISSFVVYDESDEQTKLAFVDGLLESAAEYDETHGTQTVSQLLLWGILKFFEVGEAESKVRGVFQTTEKDSLVDLDLMLKEFAAQELDMDAKADALGDRFFEGLKDFRQFNAILKQEGAGIVDISDPDLTRESYEGLMENKRVLLFNGQTFERVDADDKRIDFQVLRASQTFALNKRAYRFAENSQWADYVVIEILPDMPDLLQREATLLQNQYPKVFDFLQKNQDPQTYYDAPKVASLPLKKDMNPSVFAEHFNRLFFVYDPVAKTMFSRTQIAQLVEGGNFIGAVVHRMKIENVDVFVLDQRPQNVSRLSPEGILKVHADAERISRATSQDVIQGKLSQLSRNGGFVIQGENVFLASSKRAFDWVTYDGLGQDFIYIPSLNIGVFVAQEKAPEPFKEPAKLSIESLNPKNIEPEILQGAQAFIEGIYDVISFEQSPYAVLESAFPSWKFGGSLLGTELSGFGNDLKEMGYLQEVGLDGGGTGFEPTDKFLDIVDPLEEFDLQGIEQQFKENILNQLKRGGRRSASDFPEINGNKTVIFDFLKELGYLSEDGLPQNVPQGVEDLSLENDQGQSLVASVRQDLYNRVMNAAFGQAYSEQLYSVIDARAGKSSQENNVPEMIGFLQEWGDLNEDEQVLIDTLLNGLDGENKFKGLREIQKFYEKQRFASSQGYLPGQTQANIKLRVIQNQRDLQEFRALIDQFRYLKELIEQVSESQESLPVTLVGEKTFLHVKAMGVTDAAMMADDDAERLLNDYFWSSFGSEVLAKSRNLEGQLSGLDATQIQRIVGRVLKKIDDSTYRWEQGNDSIDFKISEDQSKLLVSRSWRDGIKELDIADHLIWKPIKALISGEAAQPKRLIFKPVSPKNPLDAIQFKNWPLVEYIFKLQNNIPSRQPIGQDYMKAQIVQQRFNMSDEQLFQEMVVEALANKANDLPIEQLYFHIRRNDGQALAYLRNKYPFDVARSGNYVVYWILEVMTALYRNENNNDYYADLPWQRGKDSVVSEEDVRLLKENGFLPYNFDYAMMGQQKEDVGGIDLNPTELNLKESGGVSSDLLNPLSNQLMNQDFIGIVPVILNIKPVNINTLLTGKTSGSPAQQASRDFPKMAYLKE